MGIGSLFKKATSIATGGLINPGSGDMGFFAGIPGMEGFAQEDTQQFNSAEALKNRAFQQQMSSTAHQRQMEDMRKAGLNPILSAGAGASTPSGSSASASSSSGGALASVAKDLVSGKSDLNKAQSKLSGEQLNTQKENTKLMKLQQQVASNTAKKIAVETAKTGQQYNIDKPLEKFQKDYGDLDLKQRKIQDLLQNSAKTFTDFTTGQVGNVGGKIIDKIGGAIQKGKNKKFEKKIIKRREQRSKQRKY